jgi:hypothetical protein
MKPLSMTTGLVAALLAPLLLAVPPEPTVQEDAAEGNYMTVFQRLVPLEGKSMRDAYELLERVDRYFSVHYSDTYRFQFRNGEFDDDAWYTFAEFDRFDHFLAVQREQATDEGWQALVNEWLEMFESDAATFLFPLNGVGVGEGGGIRVMKVTRSPDSKIPLARRFAERVATHLSARHEGLQVRTFSADVHRPGVIYWLFDYSGGNVGWESVRLLLLEDDEYIQMHEEGEELFIDAETTVVAMV